MTEPPSSPTTPAQIRAILFENPSRVTDAQLVALLLGKGSRSKIRGRPRRSWTCVELGEALYRETGGELSDFVRTTRRGTLDLKSFGIGPKLGARLVATAELAHRWRRGFRLGGNAEIRSDVELESLVFEHLDRISEGELLTFLIERHSYGEDTRRLLEFFGTPQALVESLELDTFTATREGTHSYMTLAEAGLKTKIGDVGRALAGLELARRFRHQATLERRKLSGGASGLSSLDLVTLLDTERRLDRPLREALVEILRTHPDVARDFEDLEKLAAEAGAESYGEAVEAHQLFEDLLQRTSWSDPAEVLGARVPFARLLSIAKAKIARAADPPERLLEIQKLLLSAQREATRGPVASFVETLRGLGINDEGAQEALEEARRRYFERPAPATEAAG